MGALRASRPRFRRAGDPPHVELTDDDVAILRTVYRHRFVRAEDLYQLFSNRSADRLSRRLTLLFRAEYLDRPPSQIDRFKEGGGSQSMVYGLGAKGAKYLKERVGTPIGATDWRSRNRTYTRDNLDHTLAVSTYLINLELACRKRGDVSLIHFERILERAPEATRRSPIPSRWTVEVNVNGTQATIMLAPDAIFALQYMNDGKLGRSYFFLEMDMGTMTIAPAESVRRSEAFLYRATLLRKCLAYAESWRQDRHRNHFGIGSARVLTHTTTEARSEAIKLATRSIEQGMKLSAGFFLFGHGYARPSLVELLEVCPVL